MQGYGGQHVKVRLPPSTPWSAVMSTSLLSVQCFVATHAQARTCYSTGVTWSSRLQGCTWHHQNYRAQRGKSISPFDTASFVHYIIAHPYISLTVSLSTLSHRGVQEYVEATEPKVVVGEVWTDCCYDAGGGLAYDQDPHRQRIVDWCDATGGTAAGFDFSSKVCPHILFTQFR